MLQDATLLFAMLQDATLLLMTAAC
jgi:hypothetical protein